MCDTGVGRNIRRDLIKTPSRRHFESKRTSKTGSTSKIGSRNGFVRFRNFCIFRSLSPHGVLNSVHKLTVTYYGEITIEPILNPEFDVDHDFEVKNGCFQSLFPRFRVISAYSTGRASHSDHFSGQVSMATIGRHRMRMLRELLTIDPNRRPTLLSRQGHSHGCRLCLCHIRSGRRLCGSSASASLNSSESVSRITSQKCYI